MWIQEVRRKGREGKIAKKSEIDGRGVMKCNIRKLQTWQ
jgi:hypothetical protein